MPSRSSTRWIAPLSLLATFAAILVILGGGGDEDGARPAVQPPADGRPAARSTSSSPSRTTTTRRRRSTYRVRSGDVLSTIADRTGVSVERLMELNPDLDPQALRVGQRLKLRE